MTAVAVVTVASLPQSCEVCGSAQRVLISEPGSVDSAPVLCPHCIWSLPVVVIRREVRP